MGIDKVSVVINNYFDSECDVDTTIRQAYERGFRRGASKYKSLSMRASELSEENFKLRELCADISSCHIDKSCEDCDMLGQCHDEMETLSRWDKACLFERRIDQRMRELGIEV